jgi:predicted metal-dependent phosphoesterase TrpH
MLIGLHTHTKPRSWDSFLTPDEMVDLAKEAGLDAMVVSEHDWAWEVEEAAELAKRHDFTILRAMEINTEDGHILVFGLHEYKFGMHRSHELADFVNAVGGVMIAAHPYRRQMPWKPEDEAEYEEALRRATRNPAYRFVTAVEVLNGRGTLDENEFSRRVCEEMHLPATGADDTHQHDEKDQQMGRTATYFDADIRTEEALIEALKSGRYWPIDLTKGKLTANPLYYDVPSDIESRWADQAEARRALLESATGGD